MTSEIKKFTKIDEKYHFRSKTTKHTKNSPVQTNKLFIENCVLETHLQLEKHRVKQ